MSVGQILFDVLDYHQDLYYLDTKRKARTFALALGLLVVQLVLTFLFAKVVGPSAFFFLGVVSGMCIYSLLDAISARRLHAAYLRYRLEVECDAYSEEAKK